MVTTNLLMLVRHGRARTLRSARNHRRALLARDPSPWRQHIGNRDLDRRRRFIEESRMKTVNSCNVGASDLIAAGTRNISVFDKNGGIETCLQECAAARREGAEVLAVAEGAFG